MHFHQAGDFVTFTTWSSVNSDYPHLPFSVPMPLHLQPPNGVIGVTSR